MKSQIIVGIAQPSINIMEKGEVSFSTPFFSIVLTQDPSFFQKTVANLSLLVSTVGTDSIKSQ